MLLRHVMRIRYVTLRMLVHSNGVSKEATKFAKKVIS